MAAASGGGGRGVRRRWPWRPTEVAAGGGGCGGEMQRRWKLTGGVPPGWGKITLVLIVLATQDLDP
jgi:hypothetical protein